MICVFGPAASAAGLKVQIGAIAPFRSFAMSDQFWMREALVVARQGALLGEVPVGAVIIKDELSSLALTMGGKEQRIQLLMQN